jgi:hypothetical protein
LIDNLAQLHTAIVAGLQTKLTGMVTVDAYPVIQRRINIPAVLVELSEMDAGTDPGTGETALIGHFQARAVIDPNPSDAYMQVRELAARIAVAIQHETWGLDISVSKLLQIGEDAFKPELDGYLCWMVEWTHEFHLGQTAWPYPDETGLTLMLGLYPDTGTGNEDKYWESGTDPEAPNE